MFRLASFSLVALICGCPQVIDEGTTDIGWWEEYDTGTDTGTDTDAVPLTMAVVTTVSNDYASAVLATVDLGTWAIHDDLTTIPTDNGVATDGSLVYVLGRFGYDFVRVYEPGSWTTPLGEFSTGDATNPQGVANCGGNLYVPTYGDSQLRAYDPTSFLLTGAVDLTAYADSDGIPEMADMIQRGDTLYLALQQLDEAHGWVASGGQILQIDCASGAVTHAYGASGDPSLHEWPGHDGFIVRTGVYYDADYNLAFDGGVATFDPETGFLSDDLLDEATLGANITDVAMVDGEHGIVLTQDETSMYTVWCWNLSTNELVDLFSTASYLQSVKAASSTEAWILARQGYADPSAEGGIITVDAVACAAGAEVWHTDLGFAPYSVAFY